MPLFWHLQYKRWYDEGAGTRAMMGPEGPYPCPYDVDNYPVAYKWWVRGWSHVHEKMKRHPEKEEM